MTMDRPLDKDRFGPNQWLVDEMHRRYLENPKSVGESWQEFFEGYAPQGPRSVPRKEAPQRAEPEASIQEAESTPAPGEATEIPDDASPLRGIAARIAENMERSLGVPTATSVRSVPAKLLEENRRVINRWLQGHRGG